MSDDFDVELQSPLYDSPKSSFDVTNRRSSYNFLCKRHPQDR